MRGFLQYILLAAVSFDVLLRSMSLMLCSVNPMSMCQMRMVGCLFVLAFFMMLGGCFVRTGRVRVIFRCALRGLLLHSTCVTP